MAHKIQFENDITSPNVGEAINYDKDQNITTENENLTIKGTREAVTENHVNEAEPNNITSNTGNKNTAIDNFKEEESESVSNLKVEKNCEQNAKKAKKRTSELELLGADATVKTDGSEGTYDVFGDDSKVYRKYKLRKSEQTISYKEPPNWKLKHYDTSEDEEMNTDSLECPVCEQGFDSKVALSNHARCHNTAVSQYKCSLCSLKFENNTDLVAHKSIHTESFLCKMCKLAFSDHCDYLIHNLIHTPKNKIKCPECGLNYKKNGYKVHIYTHFDKKTTCPMCPFVTNGEFNLKSHINLQHKSKLTCVECGKELKSKEMYDYHMGIHTGVKKFQCLYCGKCFRNNSQRNVHTRIHTGEKPYGCDVCGQKFRQSTDLKHHKVTHETVKKHACEICGKKYFHKYYMKAHMRSHGKEKKTYPCPECDYSSITTSGLRTHIMFKHVEDRPVECKVCNKKFINNSKFNQHRATKYHKRNVYGSMLKKNDGEE